MPALSQSSLSRPGLDHMSAISVAFRFEKSRRGKAENQNFANRQYRIAGVLFLKRIGIVRIWM